MLVEIPKLLSAEQVAQFRQVLDAAAWVDGRTTAGQIAGQVKDNQQIAETNPVARQLGDALLMELRRSQIFSSAALPLRVYPPQFNRYAGGQNYGTHFDTSIRQVGDTMFRVRADISATVFLSAPEDYDGGELIIEDTYGVHAVKLAAGDMVLYPGNSLHRVQPVTRGARVASFFWIQSMIRADHQRAILYNLDLAIQKLVADRGAFGTITQFTSIYHNLLREWADT